MPSCLGMSCTMRHWSTLNNRVSARCWGTTVTGCEETGSHSLGCVITGTREPLSPFKQVFGTLVRWGRTGEWGDMRHFWVLLDWKGLHHSRSMYKARAPSALVLSLYMPFLLYYLYRSSVLFLHLVFYSINSFINSGFMLLFFLFCVRTSGVFWKYHDI